MGNNGDKLLLLDRDYDGSKSSTFGFRSFRRGGKIGRNASERLLLWLLILSAMLFIYLAFLGLNIRFPGMLERIVSISPNKRQVCSGYKVWPVREYPPCEVKLLESVDQFKEPKDYMNFTKFSLEYIEQEENHLGINGLKNNFVGHQTMQEREKSFFVRDQKLHCGFVKGPLENQSSGFDIDENDKAYMNTCKIAVSSSILGSSDLLKIPVTTNMSEYTKQNVCFVMFVDEQTLSTFSKEGHTRDERGYIGLWKVVVVRNLPYKDMRRSGKVPKLLPHRLFPSSRYSIWVDGKLQLNIDPMKIIESYLWRTKSEYAISNHYIRHSVCEEIIRNKQLKKYDPAALDEQIIFYQSDAGTKFDPHSEQISFDEFDNVTKFDMANPDLPSYVPEASFIVRAHTPMSNLFSCIWFNEVDRFTSRDQLAFAYTYMKLRRTNPSRPFYINMFKDCERRALVTLFPHRKNRPPRIST